MITANNGINKKLNANIDELSNKLQNYDSVSILRIIADRLSFPNYSSPYKRSLSSPYNQLFYLAGLILANPSRNSQQIDEKSWKEIEKLLESIFTSYLYLFLPHSLQEHKKPSEEWFHIREVSMVVFLKYYNESILAYNEQIIERLNCLFGKYNDIINKKAGLKVGEILEIIMWIQTTEQKKSDDLNETRVEAGKVKDISANRREIDLMELTANILALDLEDFAQTFGKDAMDNFFSLFMCKLHNKYDFRYIADVNHAALSPIVMTNDKQAICLSIRQLYIAALNHFENIVKNSSKAQSFFKHRGTWVEDKTAEIINKYLGRGKMYRNIYESPNSQNEHDIMVLLNNRILIIEVKTSPPKPPPIDPEQAFIRIRRAFCDSDTGIQKAYDQGLNLKNLIENNKYVNLYDKNGNIVVTIDESGYTQGFNIICITLDDFGSLSTDLSLLLKKQMNEKYPFVTNLYDFETLLWGFEKENKNEIDFLKYLDEREGLHGKVYTLDELEIANHYLKCGSFCEFDKADKISFDITDTSIFDKHYFSEHGAKYPIENNAKDGPYYIEIKRQGSKIITGIKGFPSTYEEINLTNNLNKTKNIIEKSDKDVRKIGRNDPCSCGSGKKYKKCCGKSKFGLR